MSPEHSTVFVVDDDTSMRDALRNLFRSVGLSVRAFATAQEFLASNYTEFSGCLVLDVRLPGLSGLDLQRHLGESNIDIPIIFVTAHGDIQMSVRAMKNGAVEFLTKPFRDQVLLDAVQQALRRHRASRAERAEMEVLRARFNSLSRREQEVFDMVVQGRLNKQIATELGTSDATVKMHRGHLMRKMRAGSLADLIRIHHKLKPLRPETPTPGP